MKIHNYPSSDGLEFGGRHRREIKSPCLLCSQGRLERSGSVAKSTVGKPLYLSVNKRSEDGGLWFDKGRGVGKDDWRACGQGEVLQSHFKGFRKQRAPLWLAYSELGCTRGKLTAWCLP